MIRGSAVMSKASQAILQAVRSQAQIIDDLLDVSRVHTGKLKLKRAALDLDDVLGEIIKATQTEIHQAGLELIYEPPREEQLIVNADPVRVEQIVWNLLHNAIKFTEPGGHIELQLARDGDMARLDVIDNGRGISPEALRPSSTSSSRSKATTRCARRTAWASGWRWCASWPRRTAGMSTPSPTAPTRAPASPCGCR